MPYSSASLAPSLMDAPERWVSFASSLRSASRSALPVPWRGKSSGMPMRHASPAPSSSSANQRSQRGAFSIVGSLRGLRHAELEPPTTLLAHQLQLSGLFRVVRVLVLHLGRITLQVNPVQPFDIGNLVVLIVVIEQIGLQERRRGQLPQLCLGQAHLLCQLRLLLVVCLCKRLLDGSGNARGVLPAVAVKQFEYLRAVALLD